MKKTRFFFVVVCVGAAIAFAAPPSQASWLSSLIKNPTKKNSVPATIVITTPAPVVESIPSNSVNNANPASEGFPNGRPWQATEDRFDRLDQAVDAVYDQTLLIKTEVNEIGVIVGTINTKVDQIDTDLGMVADEVGAINTKVDRIGTGLGMVADDVRAINGKVEAMQVDLDTVKTDVAEIKDSVMAVANDVAELKGTYDVQTSIDIGEANAGNDSVIRLFVQVSHNGTPVESLSDADFAFTNPFGPSIGGLVEPVSFLEGGNGLYSAELSYTPLVTDVWEQGGYAANVLVMGPNGEKGSSMVSFTIPGPLAP